MKRLFFIAIIVWGLLSISACGPGNGLVEFPTTVEALTAMAYAEKTLSAIDDFDTGVLETQRVSESYTDTPEPTATLTASNTPTPLPDTATPTPTETPTVTDTATNTPVPPTSTPKPTSAPTSVPASGSGGSSSGSGCTAVNSSMESQIIALINAERAKQGLSKLTQQSQLTAAARGHSQDMACNNYFSHTGPSTGSPFDRIHAQGYTFSSAGENIAAGYGSAEAVVDGWMNSPGHRDNILNSSYTQIGVGYANGESSSYGTYFTAVFASP